MKRILILLVILSCFKLGFSQTNENILKMQKDTSRFGKVILKEQIVTFTDSTVSGSNLLYRCYKTFTATQSVRDVINSGVYKIVGGSGGGSGIVPTLQQVTTAGNVTDKNIDVIINGNDNYGLSITSSGSDINNFKSEVSGLNSTAILAINKSENGTAINAISNSPNSTSINLITDSANSTAINADLSGYNSVAFLSNVNASHSVGILLTMTGTNNKAIEINFNNSDTLIWLKKNNLTSNIITGNGGIIAPLLTTSQINNNIKTLTTKQYVDSIKTTIEVIDTLSLSNRINTKLNKSDTSSLSSRIDLKLNKTDTLSLSNRINLKLNLTDTASLSNRINSKLDLTSSYNLRPYTTHETYDSILSKPTINLQYVTSKDSTTTNQIKFRNGIKLTQNSIELTPNIIDSTTANYADGIDIITTGVSSKGAYIQTNGSSSNGIYIETNGYSAHGIYIDNKGNNSYGIWNISRGVNSVPFRNNSIIYDTLALFQKNTVNSHVFRGNGSIITPLLYNNLITTGKTLVTKDYVDTIQYVRDTLMHDPTGFTNNDNINVSYDSTTRKFTLTGTYQVYHDGKLITNFNAPYTSPAHGTTLNKTYFLHLDNTGVVFDTIPWGFDEVQVASVYYGANDKISYSETHGFMAWKTHEVLHTSVGTTFSSGGDLSAYTLNSTTATDKRPNISATTIADEDLNTIDSAKTNKEYTLRYLTGATGARIYLKSQTDIVPLLANRPYYNQFTGGAWQQTLFAANDYGAVFIIAIPATKDGGSQLYRYQFVQPQQVSQTLANIQGLTPLNVNLGETYGAEFVYIGKIIIRYVGGGTANWSIIQVDKLTGSRFNQSSITSGFLSTVATDASLTGNGTAASPLSVVKSVWVNIPDSPTRATSTTFTITGDYSSYIAKGLVIKWTESTTIRCAMVSIPSTFGSPNTTVTLIGDTIVAAGFDALSVKYYLGEATEIKFSYAGAVGAIDTNITNSYYAKQPMRIFGADLQVGVAGVTNSTTFDINKNWVSMFTIKPTLATTVRSSPIPFTAIIYTSLALGDKLTVDCDDIQTTVAQDAYIQLYGIPTRILNLQ